MSTIFRFRLKRAASGVALLAVVVSGSLKAADLPERFQRIKHRNPGLVVDLGVGLWGWPVPCDRNADGLSDLIVIAGSSPYRGTYCFENTGKRDPETGIEVFKTAVRLSDGTNDITPSYTPAGIRVLTPGFEHPDFVQKGLGAGVTLPVDPTKIHQTSGRIRGNQWSYVDYDGNGALDLIVGIGDWTDYGWDNAYDENGRWVNGPLHGFVYLLLNEGTNEKPAYRAPQRLQADGRPIDVFGMPSPVFADFRGVGKLELICGEFVDGLTFFQNTGTRNQPRYAPGRRLRAEGRPITMPLAMIVVTAYDWNRDGRIDLVIAQEDGRVAWLENTGRVTDGVPDFSPPRFFLQEADDVKFGVLTTPVSFDWDGDGRSDIITGNTAGEIAFIKNLGGTPPKWDAPVLLEAADEPIHILAGYNGSIQGPAEAKWGYPNIGVGDWDGDGLPDIVANTIIGKIIWYKNVGSRQKPRLAAALPVQVAWPGKPPKPAWNWWEPAPGELVVEWRCTPYLIDLDHDGITDLVIPDHEGYLAFFRQIVQNGRRVLEPGRRIFRAKGKASFNMRQEPQPHGPIDGLLRLNYEPAGRSGRRTFCFSDWDGDGKLDLLVNSVNINFLRNVSTKSGEWVFVDEGPLDGTKLAGHSTSPTIVDWDSNGIPDLLVGAEDGFFYYLQNPRSPK